MIFVVPIMETAGTFHPDRTSISAACEESVV